MTAEPAFEIGTGELHSFEPDYRAEGLRAAAVLYSARRDPGDELTGQMVLHAAEVFADWLGASQPVPATLGERILTQLATVNQQLEKIMASQDDINTAVAEDTALLADLTTQTAAVAAAQAAFGTEITALEAQGVDTSGLVAANAQLQAAQAPLDAAVAAITAASAPPAAPVTDGSTSN